jgi:hypothetical protein
VRQEVKLAGSELDGKISEAKADLAKAVTGAAVLYAGVLLLVAAVVLFVAKFVAPWLAALIVGVVVIGIGYTLVQKGKELNPDKLKPERSMASVRKDIRTFKEAVK